MWKSIKSLGLVLIFAVTISQTHGADSVTLENVKDPGENRSDEPLAREFSLEKGVAFLDSAALQWQKQRQCFTCHTNYAHLYARPSVSADAPAAKEVRKFAEELIDKRWAEKGPRWDAEVVATGAALAFNDAATTGKLHPLTRQALDRMWTLQREDGGFTWIKCDWPPMESDDHYGATLAAIAVGRAPEKYAQTAAAAKGIESLQRYLHKNPGPTLHHRAMVLWGASHVEGLLSNEEKQAIVKQLWDLQKPDGGWGLATLGDWKRADETPQDTEHSDGYGTGFVVFILRQAGVPAGDPRIQKGIAWLKGNQRESGRWFTRSLHKDSKHFITHAGTAFAIMAIGACEEKDSNTATGRIEPPANFTALFNGKDLAGWRGGNTFDPAKLAAMPEAERKVQIEKWTASMKEHWRVDSGELVNDGNGDYATTEKDYGDFELLVDYKTVAGADSGIYLRGCPQVQIWDINQPSRAENPDRNPNKGSGGLFNNTPRTPGRDPLVVADKPFGEWNHFRILMVESQVSVWLNEKLVVDHAVMENYYDKDRKLPVPRSGPIQLQTHGGEIRWKNIFLREIGGAEARKILAEHSKASGSEK